MQQKYETEEVKDRKYDVYDKAIDLEQSIKQAMGPLPNDDEIELNV